MSVLKQTLLLLLFIVSFSCKKEESLLEEFKIGNISFNYPSDWKLVEPQTIDSYYSFITNERDTIFIEYGMYNRKIYKDGLSDNYLKQITIAGREVSVEIPKEENGSYLIYVPKIDSSSSVTISSTKNGRSEDLSKIFSTIKIDNHKPSEALYFGNLQYANRLIGNGITHYENNCLSCHSEFRTVIGPPLDENLILSKDKKWFKDYLYQKKDKQEFGLECFQFEKKDSIIVEQLVKYLKQKSNF